MSNDLEYLSKNTSNIKENWVYETIIYSQNEENTNKNKNLLKLPKFKDDNMKFSFTHRFESSERLIFNQITKIVLEAEENDMHLLICCFMINNYEFINLIENALNRLKGKIFIIVGNKYNSYITYDRKNNHKEKGLYSLVKKGAIVRYMPNAHLKFITNGKNSLISTTNFTTEGFFINPEFGLNIGELIFSEQLNRLFYYLWFKECEEILANSNWVEIHKTSKKKLEIRPISSNRPKLIITSKKKIRSLNNQRNHIIVNESLFNVIKNQINCAKESIEISVYIFTDNNRELVEIRDLLINKVKEGVKVRLIVPLIKTRNSKLMKAVLKNLSNNGIIVRYYRELHGKCLIIDRKSALIFSANFDNFLNKEESCDIGYLIKDLLTIKNLSLFYEQLWRESLKSLDHNRNPSLELQLELIIKSYELISTKPRISVSRLKNLITNCKNIRLLYDENGCILKIYGFNERWTILNIELKNQNSINDSQEVLIVEGLLTRRNMKLNKETIENDVKKLNLKLLWVN